MNYYTKESSRTETWLKKWSSGNVGSPHGTNSMVKSQWLLSMMVAFMLLTSNVSWSQIALPYTENFGTITVANGFPTVAGGAWTRSGTTTNQPTYIANQTTYNRSGNGDTKFIAFQYSSGTRYYFVGPFNLTAGTSYTSSCLYKADGLTGFGPLRLTYGTTATAVGQTNVIASVPANIQNLTFNTLTGNFVPAVTGSYYLAIESTQNGNPWYLTIDDFSFQVTPTCLAASGLTVSNLTSSSATLGWSAPSTPPSQGYQYEVRTSGTPGTAGAIVTGSTGAGVTSANILSGLSANTTYSFYVRGYCGGTDYSAWASGTFTTLCGNENAPTVVQTFATYTGFAPAPSCWSEAKGAVGSPSTLTYQDSKWINSSGFANTGSNVGVRLNLYSSNPGDWLISQPIDLGPTAGLYRISYNMAVTSYLGTTAQSTLGSHIVRIIVSTDGGATWSSANTIKTYTGVGSYSNTGQIEKIDLTGYSGVVKIAFVATTTSTSPDIDFHIDDFSVEALPVLPPNCATGLVPANLAINVVRNPSLSWTAATGSPSSYDVYLGSTSPAPLVGNVIGTSYSVPTALLANTLYYYKIVPKNANGPAVGCVEQTFTTGSAFNYCAASASSDDDTGLTNVTFNTINNSSTGTPAYSDYTALSTSVYQGSSHNLSVRVNTAGNFTVGVLAWIDWDSDGDFTDETAINLGSATNVVDGATSSSQNIVIPVVSPGDYRMRIRAVWDSTGTPTPCNNQSYSEAEDYILTVVVPPACSGTPTGGTATASTSSAPINSSFTVSVTGASAATGLTYQWESAANSNGPWTEIGGATSAILSATAGSIVEVTTYYRRKITCTSAGASAYSLPASVTTERVYCTVGGTYGDYFINNVTTTGGVSNINNSSGYTTGGYTSYTSQSVSQSEGGVVNFTVSFGGFGDPGSRIYVDWNNDSDFDDANEIVFTAGYTYTSVSGTITVPLGTSVGNHRMRIAIDYLSGTPAACGSSDYKDVEDYTFVVLPPPVIVTSFSPAYVCGQAGGSTVTITGSNFDQVSSVQFYGIEATSFNVVNSTTITAVVPAGDVTGPVSVTSTPSSNGTGTSVTIFETRPFPPSYPTLSNPEGLNGICGDGTIALSNQGAQGVWGSSNPAVATVSAGLVTSVDQGSTNITYTVTDNGCSVVANYPITVSNPIQITSNPATPVNSITGSSASFMVAATGTIVSYQWYVALAASPSSYNPISNGGIYSGANSSTLNISATTSGMNNNRYRCVITGNAPCPNATSTIALLKVGNTGITTNPANVNLCNSGQAQFTVVPVGDVDEILWFEVTEEGVDFDNPIVNGGDYSGANTTTLTVSNVTTSNHNGTGYLVMVVGPANSPISPVAYINVSVPATIGTHPTNQTVCYSGGSASFTASASNTLGYQWQFSTVGGANDANWTTITSAAGPAGISYATNSWESTNLIVNTSAAISPSGTYFYRAIALSGASCPNAKSAQAQLLINNPAVAIATPNGTVSCGGAAVTLTASGADSYLWNTGATSASISVAPASQSTYTVTGTTAGCSKQATAVTVSVSNATTATASASASTVCPGQTVQLTAAGSQAFTTQTPDLYNFSTNTSGSLASMSDATLISSGANDDTPYAASNIGFTFNFNGTNYTQFSASPDGFITLGSATAASQFTNSMTSSTNVPKIAPYWDDVALGTNGTIKVKTVGSAPNRICVIEWFVTIPRNTTGTANSTFQLWLYESTNVVEMVYGSMNSSSMSATVGIKGSSTGNYSSVTISTNTTSTTTANNANSGQPSNGRVYRFAPANLPTFTYAWTASNANGTLTGANTANATANPNAPSTTYTVVVTSSTGCTDTKTVNVTIDSGVSNFVQPTAQTYCAGQTATLSVSASGPGLQYNWYKVGNVTPVGTAATLSFANATVAQSGNYYVVVTPACGAPVTSNTVALTINPLPTATISGTTTVCTNGTAPTVTFTGATGTAPYTFTYTINGGADLTIVSNASGVATLVAPIAASGTYVYSIKSVQGQLCSQSVTGQSATITVNAAPTPIVISGTSVICANSNPTLLTAAGGAIAPSSYCIPAMVTVSAGGDYINNFSFAGIVNNGSGDAPNDYTYYSSLTANVVAGTPYPVTLQAGGTGSLYAQQFRIWVDLNKNGVFEATESVFNTTSSTYSPTNATGTITIPTTAYNGTTRLRVASKYSSTPGANASCLGESDWGEFEDYNITITGGVDPAPLVVWSSANGGLFTDASGTTPYNGTTPRSTIYARPTASGNISASITATNGCSNSGSFAITVNPVPTASISGTTAVCHNSAAPSVTFTGANASAPYTFTYSLTNVATNTTTSHTVTTTTGNSVTVVAPTNVVGTFVYDLLSVQDSSSTACSQAQSGSATVTVNPLPTATIAGTTQVCQNDTAPLVTFTGANGTAPYTFTYKLNNGSNQTVVSTGNSATVAAPTGVAGTFTYTLVSVQDSSSSTCSQAQAGTATIVVHPTPMVTTVLTNQYYYSGFATAAIPLSGTPSGVTFNITGGAAAGLPNMTVTDAIPSFIPTAVPATVTVTPVANGCTGIPKTYQIIFNPVVVNILSNHCGSVNNGLNNQIQANSVTVPGYTTTGYRFEITNLSTGEVAYVDTVQSHFKLTDTNIYAYGTTYAIRAAAYLNGQLQGYFGNTCNLTTASVQTTKVINSQCGATLAAINSSINADVVNSTNLYRFRVARADAPTTYYYVERTVANFNLTMVAGLPLTFDTEYKVDVQIRVKLAGFEAWSQFGQVCSIFTPAAPIAGLTDTYCDEYHVTSSSQLIYAISFANATEYKFRLDDGNGNILYATSATNSFSLNMVSGWAPNTLYAVAVSMKLFGSYTDFELSKNCSILTPQPARLAAIPFSAVAYPNPFAENFKINVKSSNDGQIDIKVYDMVGRLVEQRTAMFNEIDTVTIGDSYPSGVYNVIVSQNEDVKTVRVIKR